MTVASLAAVFAFVFFVKVRDWYTLLKEKFFTDKWLLFWLSKSVSHCYGIRRMMISLNN